MFGEPIKDIILGLVKEGAKYLVRRLLVGVAVITAGVGISFLFTRQFSFSAFSERLVWAGIGLVLLAAIILMGQMSAGKEFGVGSMVRNVGEARRLMENNLQIREKLEKRYDVALLAWLVGMGTIGIAALVDIMLA